jgi:hypothetical protein
MLNKSVLQVTESRDTVILSRICESAPAWKRVVTEKSTAEDGVSQSNRTGDRCHTLETSACSARLAT